MSEAATPKDRVIRVFVSSTFRDMQAERDELVLKIFPQLRRLCEERGVTRGEVDLRWGITEEQSHCGEVLPICLEAIRRCRPYFIRLLGERYGWITDAIPAEVLENEPWIREHSDDADANKDSVTKLKILHAELDNPQMADRAFFYFRDPTFIERLKDDIRQKYRDGKQKYEPRVDASARSEIENWSTNQTIRELPLITKQQNHRHARSRPLASAGTSGFARNTPKFR